jgi:hypothetical protein
MLRFTIITILLTAAGAASGADKNLLSNGDFSTAAQLNAWNCVAPNTAAAFGSYQWSNEDAGGSGTSGSMSLSATAVSTYADVYCTSTCMPVRPSAAYTLGGQNRGYAPSFECYACPDSACSVCATRLAGPTMSGTDSWARLQKPVACYRTTRTLCRARPPYPQPSAPLLHCSTTSSSPPM